MCELTLDILVINIIASKCQGFNSQTLRYDLRRLRSVSHLLIEEETMHRENVSINCPIFQKQEPVIKDITDKINQAKGVQGKARNALELQKEAGVFLSCSDFKKESLDCKNCHFIANLRKKTANLIIKAKRLA